MTMEHGANVVDVREELDLSTIPLWEHRVESAGRRSRSIVLDLTSVPFIDSAGVRALFRWALAAERVGIELTVVAAHESPVRRLLEILDLEAIAPVVDTRQQAVRAYRGPGKPGPRSSIASSN